MVAPVPPVTVPENIDVGDVIFTVVASDSDLKVCSEFINPVSVQSIHLKNYTLYLKGSLLFEIVGLYPAQSFFSINASTGSVSVATDLRLDSLEAQQYIVGSNAFGKIGN